MRHADRVRPMEVTVSVTCLPWREIASWDGASGSSASEDASFESDGTGHECVSGKLHASDSSTGSIEREAGPGARVAGCGGVR